jgi:hypothetical protein
MPQHQPKNYRRVTDPSRINSRTVWVDRRRLPRRAARRLFGYNGTDRYGKSGENPPPPKNMVTGSGQP